MTLLEGRAGLVTGAAGGIGRAVALALAAEGAAVVVNDLESQRVAGEETVRLIEQAGGRAIFVAADVSDDDDQRRLVASCVSSFGRLDFANNNAALSPLGTLEQTSIEQWDRVMAVNLKGTWLGMRHQLAQMRTQQGGSIINTASAAGVMGFAGIGAYVASKHGVIGLTRAAAIEVADAGIRVNAVCPAATRTEPLLALDEATQLGIVAPQAIKRIGEPSEVADAIVWLASDRSSLVTGVALAVDLGISAGVSHRSML
jgi:NAD(P)-dependent dehydrogenase (short-subunit alcohol dehydrogenase family)